MWDWIEKLHELQEKDLPFALVTLVESHGSSPRKMGARMIISSADESYGTVGGGLGEKLVIERALACLRDGIPCELVDFDLTEEAGQVCGGRIRFLVECSAIPASVHLFGAGHVGQALAQVLEHTPLRLSVVDARERWLMDSALGTEVRRIPGDPLLVAGQKAWSAADSVLVMTHDHSLDYALVQAILPKKPGFLGLIGSRAKRANFEKRLIAAGISPELIASHLTCPIGLVRAGDSPREIAISVAAQLLDVHYRRQAARL